MKVLSLLIFAALSMQAYSQKISIEQVKLQENNLYFFGRGINGVAGITTKKLNIADSLITHIAIGFFEKGKAKIFGICDIKNSSNNFLYIDSLESFIDIKGIYHVSIWEYKLNQAMFSRLKAILNEYKNNAIIFDKGFNISFDDTLYCSEFCAMIINQLKFPALSFEPKQYNLNNNILFKAYLNRNQLIYYPIDFFLSNKKVKKIFDWHPM